MTWLVTLLIAAAVGYGLGLAHPFVFRPPLVVGQDAAVTGAAPSVSTVADASGRVLVVTPTDAAPRVAFVLYPGALVRPQAYEWLGRALAAHGVVTLIPEFTLDLPVTDPGRAESVARRLAPGLPLFVGGHSLGGAMAAQFVGDHPDAVAGLILMAAYPPDTVDLSGAAFPAVSLRAEHDGVAPADKVTDGVRRLPPGSQLVVVAGSVHSFFGRYGPQANDGLPTVPREDAEAQVAAVLGDFLDAAG